MKRRRGISLQAWILASLLIHFLFLWVFIPIFFPSVYPDDSSELEVEFIPFEDLDEEIQKQIVAFEKKTEEIPEDSKFLGKFNHKAEKQTVSKYQSLDAFLAKPVAIEEPKPKAQPLNSKMAKGKTRKLATFYPDEVFREMVQGEESTRPERRVLVGGGLVDHIEQIEVGEDTVLNTTEFKFYGYFSRIRHKVRQYWVTNVQNAAIRTYMVGRPLASNIRHETKILLILNDVGAVKSIKVIKSSGNEALDRATIEAFVESSPFPNPPKGLLEKKNEIEITWSFLVDVT